MITGVFTKRLSSSDTLAYFPCTNTPAPCGAFAFAIFQFPTLKGATVKTPCLHCGRMFQPSRTTHVYCGPVCRVDNFRQTRNRQRVASLNLLYRIRVAHGQGADLTELFREAEILEKVGPSLRPTFTAWLWSRWDHRDASGSVARLYGSMPWPDNGYATPDKFAEAVEASGRMYSHGGDWSEAIAQAGELWRADTGRAEQ